jgi:UDPglucose--hexose-1-phosphate uridylyltransferase
MELRKDYILDRYVIVSNERSKRPFEFKKEEAKIVSSKDCFFCLGNEKLTTPELGRIDSGKRWKIRWFNNKFAAVKPEGNPMIKTDNKYFTFSDAYGFHEVIVETNDHKKQLVDLSKDEIKEILGVYSLRIKELLKKDNIKYVSVFKNHGKEAGTSLVHSHSQIIAYNKIPEQVKEKIEAVKKYKTCPYCEILNIEKGSYRRCFENKNFVAFTPYASRFHYEIWIFPKEHINSILEMNDAKLLDLAEIMKKILSKLKEINADYNMELFYSPKGEDMHFHIEISPRLALIGGFEILTGDTINSVSPEDAAKFYRGEE